MFLNSFYSTLNLLITVYSALLFLDEKKNAEDEFVHFYSGNLQHLVQIYPLRIQFLHALGLYLKDKIPEFPISCVII